uniref:SymE family type I addiction module toxin n=1 Tax=Candidatus Pantoea symbiotica TaxID=1884370 RepID=UPI0012AE4AE0
MNCIRSQRCHTPASCHRLYNAGYVRDYRNFTQPPAITLKGYWMAALGFETGQKIEVIT